MPGQWPVYEEHKIQINIRITKSGGDEEDRTPDLRIANAALSQLSYVPTRLF